MNDVPFPPNVRISTNQLFTSRVTSNALNFSGHQFLLLRNCSMYKWFLSSLYRVLISVNRHMKVQLSQISCTICIKLFQIVLYKFSL